MVRDLRAKDPAAPYIGRSKAQIMACAGQPFSYYRTGAGENLIYHYNGGGPVPGHGGSKKKKGGMLSFKRGSKNWACTATLQFQAGHLIAVHYAARKAKSPYDENGRKKPNVPHCTFSLPRCPAG